MHLLTKYAFGLYLLGSYISIHYLKVVNMQYFHFERFKGFRFLMILFLSLGTGLLCVGVLSPFIVLKLKNQPFPWLHSFPFSLGLLVGIGLHIIQLLASPFCFGQKEKLFMLVRVINSSRRCWAVGGSSEGKETWVSANRVNDWHTVPGSREPVGMLGKQNNIHHLWTSSVNIHNLQTSSVSREFIIYRLVQ